LGATEVTRITAPATAKSNVIAGVTERNTDFHAPTWSARFIGQITSSWDINEQFVIPPDISIPIDIWNKLKNIVPKKNVKSAIDSILLVPFTSSIIPTINNLG